MSQTMVSFRMDSELKTDMEKVCTELGMNMTTAFTIFARKVCREQRIPFEVSVEPRFNAESLAAFREAEDILAGRRQVKRYTDLNDLFDDLEANGDEAND